MTEDNKVLSYELGLLLDSAEALDEVLSLVKKQGAEVKNPVSQPRKIKLSYQIKKYSEAYLASPVIKITPSKITALNDSLNLAKPVLRFILLASSELKEASTKPKEASSGLSVATTPTQTMTPTKNQNDVVLSNEALEKKLEEILN